MTHTRSTRRSVTFKASRESLLLLASATALVFALSYAVHKHPQTAPEAAAVVQQDWAGHLAGLAGNAPHPQEPISSASLVVPNSVVAIPAVPAPAAANNAAARPAKARVGCDPAGCAPAKTVAALPPVASPKPPVAGVDQPAAAKVEVKAEGQSLIGRLNPLNHLPDSFRHPLDVAGDALSGWAKRL